MIIAATIIALQQTLAPVETRIARYIDADTSHALAVLERTVNINSGSLNRAGVKRVAEALAPEFQALGFTVRIEEQPDAVNRGPHLIAERKGKSGKRVLLIGHLDTVFEEASPFQRFMRIDQKTATGPGVEDMKGGNVVILSALRALNSARALDDRTITVFLTGDEESAGQPLSISRASLIASARQSDIALAFEGGSRDEEGLMAVVARRSSSGWTLRVTGKAAHSSGIFGAGTGAGAIYEAARILDRFYGEIRAGREVTFSPGLIVGGDSTTVNASGGTATGKSNIVAASVVVRGDLRTLTPEQLTQTRERMRSIVAQNLPGTSAEITFEDRYPSMPPTEGNRALLGKLDEASRALGMGRVRAFDPVMRGAGDVSFVAEYVDALDGLGPMGNAAHTINETLDVTSLAPAAKRAAVLIYRLTR